MKHENCFTHECKCGSTLEIYTDDEVTAQKDIKNWIRNHKCHPAPTAARKEPLSRTRKGTGV